MTQQGSARKLICSTCAGTGKRTRMGPAHGPDHRACGDCKGKGEFAITQPTGTTMTRAEAWEAIRPVHSLLEADWTRPDADYYRQADNRSARR